MNHEVGSYNFAVDIVDARAAHPDAVAIEWHRPDTLPLQITFHDLKLRTEKTAAMLRDHGLKRGDRVFILLPLCVAWWEVILACMKAGAVAVPAEEMQDTRTLLAQLERSKAGMVVADVSLADRLDEVIPQVPMLTCKIAVGWERDGWVDYDRRVSLAPTGFTPEATTGDEICLMLPTGDAEAPMSVCRHGDAQFGLEMLDAWRTGRTIIVRQSPAAPSES